MVLDPGLSGMETTRMADAVGHHQDVRESLVQETAKSMLQAQLASMGEDILGTRSHWRKWKDAEPSNVFC